MISDFPINRISNLGGYALFEFLPYQGIKSIPRPVNKVINQAVELLTGYTFLKGYATLETLVFSETNGKSDHGDLYKQVIKGFVPGDSPELADLLEEMELMLHLVKITDPSGRTRLVGVDSPLEFTADFDSGDAPGDKKGYSFRFFTESIKRAPFYNV